MNNSENRFKRKRGAPFTSTVNPFPISPEQTDVNNFGIFTGLSVEIFDENTIKFFHTNGCYGIGSLSRSTPICMRNVNNKIPTITRRQHQQRLEWCEKINEGVPGNDLVNIVSDNEKEIDKPKNQGIEDNITKNPFKIEESLILMPEEAFFLHYSLKCLLIKNIKNEILTTDEIFEKFSNVKPNFLSCFVAYIYLKSKNWIIKSGFKYAGDFILYKRGPRYFHASSVVYIQENSSETDQKVSKETMSSAEMHGLYRICETSGKDLIILEIYKPKSIPDERKSSILHRLREFKVSEVNPIRCSFFKLNKKRRDRI